MPFSASRPLSKRAIPDSVYCAHGALLLADAAADALSMVDDSLSVLHGNSRTSELHAGSAAYAYICINGEGCVVLYVLEQCTRTA